MSCTSSVSNAWMPITCSAETGEEREEIHPLHRFLHPVDRLVAPDLGALEVALEQGVVGGRDGLDELLVVLVEGGLLVGRDVGLGIVARLGTRCVEVGLAGEEVDHAAEGRARFRWGSRPGRPCW